ncbi:MAG: rod shape-determining protein MreC [Minisyncoccota bacterium]
MAVRRKIRQTKLFRASILFLLAWLFVVWVPAWMIAPLQASIMTLTLPIQKILSVTAFEAVDTVRFFTSIGDLKRENERLEKEYTHLLSERVNVQDILQENEMLRQQLNLLPRERFELKSAEIIGRDVSGLGNWISINQGSLNGIRQGMAVIVDAGVLVGKVVEVFPSNARIMLISNPESLISGITLNTLAQGIVNGAYGLGLSFGMVLQEDVLKIGDTVVTSGLGGDMPKGLLIGTLQEARLSNDHLFQQAPLISPLKFDHLRYVFVIMNAR